MEFGATYPFEEKTPYALGVDTLRQYAGSHGSRLAKLPTDDLMKSLPSYARTEEDHFPTWKIQYIRQNRKLYSDHKAWIDEWLPAILQFPSSLQKLEWNCKGRRAISGSS